MQIYWAISSFFFLALQNLADAKESLGPDEVKKSAFNLIMVKKFLHSNSQNY